MRTGEGGAAAFEVKEGEEGGASAGTLFKE